jgi:hypothetical protein
MADGFHVLLCRQGMAVISILNIAIHTPVPISAPPGLQGITSHCRIFLIYGSTVLNCPAG